MGLRELKKAKTRKLISDLATTLFIERGFSNVTTAEIAQKAEVSAKTLFNYFPTKESLVFDEDQETENRLVNTVINRKKGQSILDALLEAGCANIDKLKEIEKKNFKTFMSFIENTPELSAYAKQMWMRHEQALARAIKKETPSKLSMTEAEAVARFILDAYHRAMGAPQPKEALRTLFKVLENGWAG